MHQLHVTAKTDKYLQKGNSPIVVAIDGKKKNQNPNWVKFLLV